MTDLLHKVFTNTTYITVFGSVTVACIVAYAAYSSEKRQRRRVLYAQAYRDILVWTEMLYRILRRDKGNGAEGAIINLFHELQEKVLYDQGWIATESLWLSRSYARLCKTIKSSLESPIKEAWDKPLRPRWSSPQTTNQDVWAKIDVESKRFLRDVRWQLAWWRLPRITLMLYNIYWKKTDSNNQ